LTYRRKIKLLINKEKEVEEVKLSKRIEYLIEELSKKRVKIKGKIQKA